MKRKSTNKAKYEIFMNVKYVNGNPSRYPGTIIDRREGNSVDMNGSYWDYLVQDEGATTKEWRAEEQIVWAEYPEMYDKIVIRHQPGDYTDGRKGRVVEANDTIRRARVNWGGMRTWVKYDCLREANDVETIEFLKAEMNQVITK